MSDLDAVFRAEHGRIVAALARRFGDLDLAEDAASEAFVEAAQHWATAGTPPNPGGWLVTTATRKAIDRIRRESHRDDKERAAHLIFDDTPPEPTGPVVDDRLRLIFTCCHPALSPEARVALTLRMLGGLTVPEIARAFLIQDATMGQRISRAKAKIKLARIPYRIPSAEDLPVRLSAVLAVLYLIFNEGYLPGAGTAFRADLSDEAIRLGRLLHALLPDEPEVAGLLALMLLTDARRATRFAADGTLVPLAEQDRGAWNADLIAQGQRLVGVCAAAGRPGRYQVLAAINAVHTAAATAADTDWRQIVRLYDLLQALDPSPIVALNRAVAVAEVDGPAGALAEVDALPLDGYHAWHVTRAELLRRLGRGADAAAAYDIAIARTDNPAEVAYLTRRRASLT